MVRGTILRQGDSLARFHTALSILTPPAKLESRRVLTVSAFTSDLRETVESQFSDVWIEGEVSNLSLPRSGHCYFTLKDAGAQIRCVLFRGVLRRQAFVPRDGMRLRLLGGASVYEPRGDLQVKVQRIEAAGEGALQRAFEALKRRLDDEGLFASDRKVELPRYPERIGVVTSGTGAALRDVMIVLQRRFPCVEVLVCPVRVQGVGAAEEIADAIAAFDQTEGELRPDVLIVGRGGGSVEDLWAFNEEIVARALAACGIPTISAVGHETDVSIADLVADRRAATPSMAAEIAVPDRSEVAAFALGIEAALREQAEAFVREGRASVRALTGSRAFHAPRARLEETLARASALRHRLDLAAPRAASDARARLEALTQRLPLLDPRRPATLGFARVRREDTGAAVRSAEALAPGTRVVLRFPDGEARAEILSEITGRETASVKPR